MVIVVSKKCSYSLSLYKFFLFAKNCECYFQAGCLWRQVIVAALILSLKTVSQSYQGVWLSNRDAKLSDKRFALLLIKI